MWERVEATGTAGLAAAKVLTPKAERNAALAEVRMHSGVKYDADVVAACVRVVEERGFRFTP